MPLEEGTQAAYQVSERNRAANPKPKPRAPCRLWVNCAHCWHRWSTPCMPGAPCPPPPRVPTTTQRGGTQRDPQSVVWSSPLGRTWCHHIQSQVPTLHPGPSPDCRLEFLNKRWIYFFNSKALVLRLSGCRAFADSMHGPEHHACSSVVCRWRVPGAAHGAPGRLLRTPAQLLPDP